MSAQSTIPITAAGPRAQPSLLRRRLGSASTSALVVLGLLIVWELVARADGATPPAIPGPWDVLSHAWDDRSLYGTNLPPTLWVAAKGYLLGNAAAVLVGLAVAFAPMGRRELLAVAVTFYNVPVIAVAPLLVVLLSGDGPQVATAAISVFFPTLLGVINGLRAADPTQLEVVRVAGGGPIAALMKVRLRFAVPAVSAGLAVAIPYAIVGAIVGEFLGGRDSGIGPMLVQALSNLDAARVWGICLIIGALGAVGLTATLYVDRRLNAWGAPELSGRSAAGPPRSRRAQLIGAARTAIVATAIVAVVWVGGSKLLDLQPYVVKMPWDVWDYLTHGTADGLGSPSAMWRSLLTTLWHALLGCAIGVVVGAAVALVVERVRALGRVVQPLLVVFSCVPYLALVPILTLAIGHGLTMTLVLAATVALLPTVVNLRAGLRATPRTLADVMHTACATRRQRLVKLDLPVATPYLFTSLRMAAPWSLLAVLYAEWLATGGGIGTFMIEQAVNGNYDGAWAAAIMVTALAVALYLAVEIAERLALARFAPHRLD